MAVIIPTDVEKLVRDAVKAVIDAGALPTPPAGQTWKAATIVTPGVTPLWFVQVRMIGGEDEQRVAARPRVDVRLWADGTPATEAARSLAARTLLGHLQSSLRCGVFALPVALPDPADNSKIHTLFTVQLLTKGTQQ